MTGRAAPGTKAVTVHAGGQKTTASVASEHFAAWWPARAPSEELPREPLADLTFDVTTADGRVIVDASDLNGDRRPAPGPRQIGRISPGGGASEDGFVATIQGRAGHEVVSVTIHVDGVSVIAPVVDGAFAAQWPSKKAEIGPQPTFDLHLRDGSVLRKQQPPGGFSS